MNIVGRLLGRASRISSSSSSRLFQTSTTSACSSDPLRVQKAETTSDPSKEKLEDVITKVNSELATNSQGRLFAQVHLCGKQFKVTADDLIAIEGRWAPDAGERIRIEKVKLVGGENFTLIGQPVLPRDLVSVEATVVEKSITHTKLVFKKQRRENMTRHHFHRPQTTVLRINSVQITQPLRSSVVEE